MWNLENRFTGWTDVDLTRRGIEEAREAGRLLRENGFHFDLAFASLLKRAIRTLLLTLEELDALWLSVEKDCRLNERHYGALQGLNKAESRKKFGEEQVYQWRRGFAIKPPTIGPTDSRHPCFDPRYRCFDLPQEMGESLEETMHRTVDFWRQVAVPRLREGKGLLIVAHGNSLRALVKHLDNIPDEEIMAFELPTGVPLVYQFNDHLEVTGHYYLVDPIDFTRAVDRRLAEEPECGQAAL